MNLRHSMISKELKTKKIRQTVTFDTTPKKVYDLIMDEKKHSAFTRTTVTMNKDINGKFSAFEGYCTGFNIELKEGKKIIQGWHFKEDGWPDDHFSICTFEFSKVPKGTKLTFTQTNIPAHKAETLKSGWKQYYWEPLKAYLKK
jgi:activator of HSP90 ATPase